MFDRQGKELIWECDSCGDVEMREGDFDQRWAELKRDGWTALKVRPHWVYTCPKCRKEPKTFFERPE